MKNETKYRRVASDDSNEYYCPLEVVRSRNHIYGEIPDDCVEADVVGRYMGHLTIDHR